MGNELKEDPRPQSQASDAESIKPQIGLAETQHVDPEAEDQHTPIQEESPQKKSSAVKGYMANLLKSKSKDAHHKKEDKKAESKSVQNYFSKVLKSKGTKADEGHGAKVSTSIAETLKKKGTTFKGYMTKKNKAVDKVEESTQKSQSKKSSEAISKPKVTKQTTNTASWKTKISGVFETKKSPDAVKKECTKGHASPLTSYLPKMLTPKKGRREKSATRDTRDKFWTSLNYNGNHVRNDTDDGEAQESILGSSVKDYVKKYEQKHLAGGDTNRRPQCYSRPFKEFIVANLSTGEESARTTDKACVGF